MKMQFEELNYPSNLLEGKTIVISGAGSGIGCLLYTSDAADE